VGLGLILDTDPEEFERSMMKDSVAPAAALVKMESDWCILRMLKVEQ